MSREKRQSGCLGKLVKAIIGIVVLGVVGAVLLNRGKDSPAADEKSGESQSGTVDSGIQGSDQGSTVLETPTPPKGERTERPVTTVTNTQIPSEIRTQDGKVYTNASFSSYDAVGLTIMHANGVAKIQFPNLPKEIQEQFGYDPAKAAAQVKASELAEREQAKAQQGIEQKKIDSEFMQSCIDAKWVTHIEQDFGTNFYVQLPAEKYTTKENVESIAEFIAKAYVMQNANKGGTQTQATVHVFKGDEVFARGSFRR